MDFTTFQARANELFAEIPPEFLEGIDGLEVSRSTEPHPSLPDIYTLGECLTEQYPSEFGGAGEVRSIVVLYYGSFLALSRLDEAFDWEGELYETLMHEVRHHLESLATDDELEEIDYAEDQNFHRREGERSTPRSTGRGCAGATASGRWTATVSSRCRCRGGTAGRSRCSGGSRRSRSPGPSRWAICTS